MAYQIKICSLKKSLTVEEFLKNELHVSHSQIKKIIRNKKFLESQIDQEVTLPIEIINKGVAPIYEGNDIEILFENEIFIVVNKPAGVHGHPLSYLESQSVLNFLRANKCIENLGVFDDNAEKGLLYRLDGETSGVLIYVKDSKLHEKLRNDFTHIAKEKIYLAAVSGRLEICSEIENSLVGKGKRVVLGEGKPNAVATYESVLYREDLDVTLLKVSLKTGYRHQIRVQLKELGHPIIGDPLYSEKAAQRMFLHAYKYTLEFDGKEYSFKCDDQLFCDFLNLNSLSEVSS